MSVTMIAAMAHNRVIGKDNAMPWSLPAEMAHFRRSTIGKTVLMGRQTFESLGRPLKDRRNVILTRRVDYDAPEGCEIIHSVEEALSRYTDHGQEELVIIGGAQIYELFLPYADKLLITDVEADVDGDTHFPVFNLEDWTLMNNVLFHKDEKNAYKFEIRTYERNK